MKLKPIKNNREYNVYLDWVDAMFDKKVKPNTSAGEQVQIALLLIKQWEDDNYNIPVPDLIEVIKIKMHSFLLPFGGRG